MNRNIIISPCMLVGVLLLTCSGATCTNQFVSYNSLFEGLEDVLDGLEPISAFDGDWLSEEHVYALRITDRIGVLTLANSQERKVGEEVLVIASVNDNGFSGRQVFRDGLIYDVVAEWSDPNTLLMTGGGWTWTLAKVQPATVNLTVSVVGEGTVEPGSGTFTANEEVTLTATAAAGWRFDYWEGDLTTKAYDHWRDSILPLANPATLIMDGDKAVTAVFKQRQTETETFDLGGGVTLKVISMPGGTFTMGSSAEEQARFENQYNSFENEGPQHTVTVSPFAMGETEVTQAQFRAVMDFVATVPQNCTGDCFNDVLDDNHPVAWVTWEDAVNFCDKLSEMTGRAFRLPTEAEWEYACRASSTTAYSFGDSEDELDDYAWFGLSGSLRTPEDVATKLPNAFGLYDMHGNVWEWVGDWYNEYSSEAQVDPTGLSEIRSERTKKLVRGGAYSRYALHCRSATRYAYGPTTRTAFNIGFRVVCE